MNQRTQVSTLIDAVFHENLRLKNMGLVIQTWGNVSAIDREKGIVAIKPSGVDYERMTADDIVLTDLSGRLLDSRLKPSSDLPTHLVLYNAFPGIGGIVHTHSIYAVAFAQACQSLPCMGTTHADYFYGTIPVTDIMSPEDIHPNYEIRTGDMMVKKIRELGFDPMTRPSILVANHGPFSWGLTAREAVDNAFVLETVCKMAAISRLLSGQLNPIGQSLLDKHYLRKHGAHAYYGQNKKE